jgi:hypothetical protein
MENGTRDLRYVESYRTHYHNVTTRKPYFRNAAGNPF